MKLSGLPLPNGVIDNFDNYITSTDLDNEKWVYIVHRTFIGIEIQWPAVSKMSMRDIGSIENFNSGLWALFHHLILSSKDPDNVAEAIKNFVQHFITCRFCHYHFMRM